jgi:glycine/D-amino acid oxidase-like deaminating enzyme/nitrite reductase/ring-hydroxylating ferredoxin subunit
VTFDIHRTSGSATTPWIASTGRAVFPPLSLDLESEVCVIGGGISGLSVAYELLREGREVVVLEDGELGSGETGRTTAHLTSALDDGYLKLERLHGEKGAFLAAESHARAIDEIEAIVGRHRIPCDFRRVPGYLLQGLVNNLVHLDGEVEAARRAGVLGVERLDRAPGLPFDSGPCLHFPRQAEIHPLSYLLGLSQAVVEQGGKIFCRTHAVRVEEGKRHVVRTGSGHGVRARHVVVATNAPVISRVRLPLKQTAYRTHVIGARVPAGSVGRALYWDLASPYHYVRLASVPAEHGSSERLSDLLLVGGEDEKTGHDVDPDARVAALERWMRERFSRAGPVEYAWSGQVLEPVDALAYIGRYGKEPGVYVVTGDSGHGMTHGMIAGILLRDLIRGHSNPWETLYDPSRLSLRALPHLVRENLHVLAEYRQWLRPGDVVSAEEIPVDSGRVLRGTAGSIACYRDERGTVHRRSAVCPHLGCRVNWNDLERTWDCPCHGSRFGPLGQVLNGPANRDLAEEPGPARPAPAQDLQARPFLESGTSDPAET